MWFNREPLLCSELLRTPQEILAFAAVPAALRPQRMRTHAYTTILKYIPGLAHFIGWCQELGYCPLPALPETVLEYLRYLQDIGHGIPDTLARLSPIGCWHRTHDLPLPKSRELSTYIHALRRLHVPKRATPLTVTDIVALCKAIALERPLRAARDTALLLICFVAALRPSELRAMLVEHLDFRERGLLLTIPSSKCNFNKPTIMTLAYANGEWCAVRALQRWLWLAQIEDGYVFRWIERNDHMIGDRLFSRATIGNIFARYARRIGLRGNIKPYSARRGCATSLIENGATLEQASKHLRHKHTETTEIYVDDRPVPFHRSITPLILP